jgi:hypothetical protein
VEIMEMDVTVEIMEMDVTLIQSHHARVQPGDKK